MLSAKNSLSPKNDPLIIIIISVLVASVVTIYPLPYDTAIWRPCFLMLVTLFWVLCQPSWCGVWFAFATGLFTDLLIDAPLGQSALIYVILTFTTRYFVREKRVLNFLMLWLIISLSVISYGVFLWLTQMAVHINYPMMHRLPPILSSILIWPIIYTLLKKWRI